VSNGCSKCKRSTDERCPLIFRFIIRLHGAEVSRPYVCPRTSLRSKSDRCLSSGNTKIQSRLVPRKHGIDECTFPCSRELALDNRFASNNIPQHPTTYLTTAPQSVRRPADERSSLSGPTCFSLRTDFRIGLCWKTMTSQKDCDNSVQS